MKLYFLALLLGYVLHNISGYSNFVTTDIYSGHAGHYKMKKRQISDFDQFRRCQGTVLAEQCTGGMVQELVDLASQCNQSQAAILLQNNCQRNQMGDRCGIALAHSFTTNEIETECVGTCTTRCQNLLMNIRNELGCCINVILNDTSSPLYNPTAFSYSLWASCGVEPAPDDCTNDLIMTPTPIDPSCTLSAYLLRTGNITCSTRYIEPVLEALANVNDCEIYSQVTREQCGVNEAGVPCYATDVTSMYVAASLVCTTTTRCSADCRASLQSIRSSAGCCINNIFNGSANEIADVSDPILTYEFWRRCGVATPGICEAQFNSATTNTALNKLALILVPILMAANF